MRRSGALGSTAGLTNVRRGRTNAVAGGGPQIRYVKNLTGTGLNWSAGTPTTNFTDVAPGDNTTYEQQTGTPPAVVAALYDLGSAQTVTRVRKRHGNIGGNNWGPHVEASNDGNNWVDAYTGPLLPLEPAGGSIFVWRNEYDLVNITATPYRYWRVVCRCQGDGEGGTSDSRIGDFRLYVGGNLVL